MQFEFYSDALATTPKISVDGLVPNSIHLSHWRGNETPLALKRDTSTEIVLAWAEKPETERNAVTRNIDLCTNNHFDTDGLLSVWTMLAGERALDLAPVLAAAAEAGDFSAFSSPEAVRISLVLQGDEDDDGSPLARYLAADPIDEKRSYAFCLPEVERLLNRPSDFESLWRERWNKIARALDSFASGRSTVNVDESKRVALVTLSPDLRAGDGHRATRHSASTIAISANVAADLICIALPVGDGFLYQADWAYHSWADTVRRPKMVRCDLSGVVARLQAQERGQTRWRIDTSGLTSALRMDDTPSSLVPDEVARELRRALVSERG